MKISFKSILVLMMSLLLLVGSPSFAFATSTDSSSSDDAIKKFDLKTDRSYKAALKDLGFSESKLKQLQKEFKTIKPYFKKDQNNAVYFDAKSALANGADSQLVKKVKNDMTNVKSAIKSSSHSQKSYIAGNCPGYNLWYGTQNMLLLDNCLTKDLVFFISMDAGIHAIAGAIISALFVPAGVPILVASALYVMGVAYINWVNRGYGIGIFTSRTPIEIYGQ